MERTFKMDFEDRAEHVREAIAEVLDDDTDAFVRACEEIDNYSGILGEARCNEMWQIDEFFDKPSDLLDAMSDFNSDDEYFYFSLGYVATTSDKYDVYSDEVSVDDIIDAIERDYNHLDLSFDTTLDNLAEILFNEDFGIDEDFDEDDIEDYESDEEFTQRIADIM